MDCLRSAIRAGASEAVCFYRRDLDNMPGNRQEYANAIEEGARFQFLTNPIRLLGNAAGEVARIRCIRMELGMPDASGDSKPQPVPGSEFEEAADVIIVAYGFDPEPIPGDNNLAQVGVNHWGGVIVDDAQMTTLPGVFAGGDIVRGPSLVVQAVRDGRRAAEGIHQYLMNQSVTL